MLGVLSATVPIFLVVALGYACTCFGLFSRDDIAILNRFVVRIALPLLVFVNVTGRSFSDIFNAAYLLTYALASMAMFGIAHVWAGLRRAPATRAAFLGMAMGGTNNGFVGFAIFLIVLPDVAGIAVGMDMLVDNTLIIPLTLFLAERATARGGSALGTLGRSLASVIRHPMVVAIIVALTLTAVGWTLPPVLARPVGLVAQTSSGVALFAIGGMLVGLKLGGALADIVFSVAGKLLLMPAVGLALVFALEAAGLPPMSTQLKAAAIITTALPTFSIVPALAEKYGEADWTPASVMAGTVASFVTLTGWMWLLTVLGWL